MLYLDIAGVLFNYSISYIMKKYILIIVAFFCFITVKANTSDFDSSAYWIIAPHNPSMTNTWSCFRKIVNIKEVPETLTANIAVDSKYWMWINGKMVVFEGGLKRGPAPHAGYYDQVNIAPYLKKGDNVIAVLLWYFGANGLSHASTGTAAILFSATNNDIKILSDNTWIGCNSHAYGNTKPPYPNWRLSEGNIRYDARFEDAGWKDLIFKNNWGNVWYVADIENSPFGKLVKRPIPMWKDYGLKSYESQCIHGDTIICKLPYDAQVTPYFKVEASAGKEIRMETDDYHVSGIESVRGEYVTCDGVQEYESYGWMNGHYMYYIIPKGVKVLSLKYRETGYNAEFTGKFTCNDEFLNELWKRSARTLYVNMRDNYMDCPDRERAQWIGDVTNEMGQTFYALNTPAQLLARKALIELVNWQRKTGEMWAPIPSCNWGKELPLQTLAALSWYGVYMQAYYSGDFSFFSDIYDGVHKYLHRVWQVDEKGFPVFRIGEWSWGDWGENKDMGMLTTCWYYLALKSEQSMANKLGKTEDAATDSVMMKQIKDGFDARYWDGKVFRSPDYKDVTDDRAQAMAVICDLASPDKYTQIAKTLLVQKSASPYMEKYVLEALFKMKKADQAINRMKERYSKMLSFKQYTTLFEGWDYTKRGFGYNHAWSGGALTVMSSKIAGIEPIEPGFKKFSIAPQLGHLRHVSATVPTHYGNIVIDINKSESSLSAHVIIPKGTTAIFKFKEKEVKLQAGEHNVKGRAL